MAAASGFSVGMLSKMIFSADVMGTARNMPTTWSFHCKHGAIFKNCAKKKEERWISPPRENPDLRNYKP